MQNKRPKENRTKKTLGRAAKCGHIRKSRMSLSEWCTEDDQFNGKGIEEYQSVNADRCSKVHVVTLNERNESLMTTECRRAAVLKSESVENEENGSKTGAFSDDLAAYYLHETHFKTSFEWKGKLAKVANFRKKNRSMDQAKVSEHTNWDETLKQYSINITNLQSNSLFLERGSFFSQTSPSRSSVVRRCSDLRKNNVRIHDEDVGDQFSKNVPVISSTSGLITCPINVYTFYRGLIPSKEAHDLESFHCQRVLPSVIVDQAERKTGQKCYRLTLERGVNRQTNLSSRRCQRDNTSGSTNSSAVGGKERVEAKLVASKIFPAEKVIPVAQNRRRYFDFKGYIEFLCKERSKKTSSKHTAALNSSFPEEYELSSTASNSWFNDNFDAVFGLYDYTKMFDVKGSQLKLDENPSQVRRQKPQDTNLGKENGHQNCCVGNRRKHVIKTTQDKQQKQMTQENHPSVTIQRLSSKFQFVFPGRPPSSDDSGFTE